MAEEIKNKEEAKVAETEKIRKREELRVAKTEEVKNREEARVSETVEVRNGKEAMVVDVEEPHPIQYPEEIEIRRERAGQFVHGFTKLLFATWRIH